MVAVTLSTVGCRSSAVGPAAVEVVGRGSFVGGRELPVVVQTIVNVPGDRVGGAVAGRAAAGRAVGGGAFSVVGSSVVMLIRCALASLRLIGC